jgi:hypothetical protein
MNIDSAYLRTLPIFFYDKDVSSEYTIEKTTVDDRNIFDIYDEIKTTKKIVSFYGDLGAINELLKNILGADPKLKLPDQCPASIIMVVDKKAEVCFSCLVCDSDKLFDKKPLNKESLIITLHRFLLDISDHIFIVPREITLQNWTNQVKPNPFNSGFKTTKKFTVKQSTTIEIKVEKIETNTESLSEYFKNSDVFGLTFQNNYSKIFFSTKKVVKGGLVQEKFRNIYNHLMKDLVKLDSKQKMSTLVSYVLSTYELSDSTFFFNLEKCLSAFQERTIKILNDFKHSATFQFQNGILDFDSKKGFLNSIKSFFKSSEYHGDYHINVDVIVKMVMNQNSSNIFFFDKDQLFLNDKTIHNIIWHVLDNVALKLRGQINEDKLNSVKREFHNFYYNYDSRKEEILYQYKELNTNISEEFFKFQNMFNKIQSEYLLKKSSSDYYEITRC